MASGISRRKQILGRKIHLCSRSDSGKTTFVGSEMYETSRRLVTLPKEWSSQEPLKFQMPNRDQHLPVIGWVELLSRADT